MNYLKVNLDVEELFLMSKGLIWKINLKFMQRRDKEDSRTWSVCSLCSLFGENIHIF